VVTSDVFQPPYVDLKMSAYDIKPPEVGFWANIFAIDVLHHLMTPLDFLQSAASALAPGGRLILVEPAATMGGCLFYRLFHPEPVESGKIGPPFEFSPNGPGGGFANMGMGVALFRTHKAEMRRLLAEMGLICESVVYRDVLAYPATGGYSKPQLLPTRSIRCLLSIEKRLPQAMLRSLGLRMRIVLRKRA
jgi:SAM-dependent methyltransferase